MTIELAPTQSDIQAAVGRFLDALALRFTAPQTAMEIVEGMDNRVSEPVGPDFITMTVLGRPRMGTNIDDFADVAFTGSIAGTVMTVTAVSQGAIKAGRRVFGTDVNPATTVTVQTSGPAGGVGTYTIAPSQTVAQETLAAGASTSVQATEVTVQLDVHGPNSADNAQVISTLFRDPFATEFFEADGIDAAPLFVDDPRQVPFINAEKQYENRWVVDLHLHVNETVSGLPQQAATVVSITAVSVDSAFPPA